MTGDIISRQSVYDALNTINGTAELDKAFEVIEQLPSAEKIGHWKPTEYRSYADGSPVYDLWVCSNCGYEHSGEEDTLTNYCCECGCRMVEEGEQTDG